MKHPLFPILAVALFVATPALGSTRLLTPNSLSVLKTCAILLKQKIKVWRGIEKDFAWTVSQKELREMTPRILDRFFFETIDGAQISEKDLGELQRYVRNPDLFGGDIKALEQHLMERFDYNIFIQPSASWRRLKLRSNLNDSILLLNTYDQHHGTHHASDAILHLFRQKEFKVDVSTAIGSSALTHWIEILGEIKTSQESAQAIAVLAPSLPFWSSLSEHGELNVSFSRSFKNLLLKTAQPGPQPIPIELLAQFTFNLVVNSYGLSDDNGQFLLQRECAKHYIEALREYFSLIHETAFAENLGGALAVIERETREHYLLEDLRAPYRTLGFDNTNGFITYDELDRIYGQMGVPTPTRVLSFRGEKLENALAKHFPFHSLN